MVLIDTENTISTTEAAKILGISREAVLKRIKKGRLKAKKVGRNYAIDRNEIADISGEELSTKQKEVITKSVKRVVKEYGETLKLLGKE